MAEFQFCLEEVRLEPVDGGVVESIAEEGFGRRTSDAPTCGDDLFVLLLDDGIADAGVRGRHLRTAVAEDGHNRLDPSATFGELSAHGVAEPVRSHSRTALAIDQPGLAAGDRQRLFE
jgi:hypothetical protein